MKFGQTLIVTFLALSQSSAFGLSRTAPKAGIAQFNGRLSKPVIDTSPLVQVRLERRTAGVKRQQHTAPPTTIANIFSSSLRSSPQPVGLNTQLSSSPALDVQATPRGGMLSSLKNVDLPLMAYFFFWYVGNYYYNITNKLALKAAGGSSGYPMTISSLQLGVGCIYALFMWAAPDARARPKISFDDVIKMLPVAFCSMGAHSASVFALSAGAVSFGQIVKSAEPAFAAVLSQFVYGKKISKAKVRDE